LHPQINSFAASDIFYSSFQLLVFHLNPINFITPIAAERLKKDTRGRKMMGNDSLVIVAFDSSQLFVRSSYQHAQKSVLHQGN
jgi:hypothetical protein